jgi:hypothetical protein
MDKEGFMRFLRINAVLLCALAFSAHAQPEYYGMMSGGYGVFQDVFPQDATSGVLRFSLGTQIPIKKNLTVGVEIGTQTGNRMRLNDANAIPAVGTAPVFLTVKPVVDALGTVTWHFNKSALFLDIKGGVFYAQGMVDSLTIPNRNQVSPEIMAGLGIHLTPRVSTVVYYQRVFSGQVRLTQVDVSTGEANLSQLPTLQAGFIGLKMHF